ncbi:hypothetical protein [Stieleria varia]|uniref:DUF4350 domain-containing protein n=1 Tax=Stieleria varia TaxID=2528005 RepID=A0A5C5ZVX7_9BACT|nr:hypothetical protein [Stieleria varia]TWT91300.1 hypothetical protein Pla52n_66340 [Stieleria varia]
MRTSHAVLLLTALILCVFSGCGSEGISTQYGSSKGFSGRSSVNGFTAMRGAYVKAGFQDRDVTRLSNRIRKIDTIVWTPVYLSPISGPVTNWMESWLAQGNRTLVYIVPDSGSEADYWRQARPGAAPSERLEYRRRYAKALNQQQRWQLNRSSITSNGWFDLKPKLQDSVARDLIAEGRGQGDSDASNAESSESDESSVRLEWIIQPHDSNTGNQTGSTAYSGFSIGPTGPNAPSWGGYVELQESNTEVDFDSEITNADSDSIVAKITSTNWPNSRILVVAGGSLLTNFAMTRPSNRQLLGTLISQSSPTQTDPIAGFCNAPGDLPISETSNTVEKSAGMELLTVYPISLVTVHAALLGLIACLMMLPIFGRAKKIDRGSQNDFGDHLDAVAQLMRKNGGAQFAHRQISDYMVRVRGETVGSWVMPESLHKTQIIESPRK